MDASILRQFHQAIVPGRHRSRPCVQLVQPLACPRHTVRHHEVRVVNGHRVSAVALELDRISTRLLGRDDVRRSALVASAVVAGYLGDDVDGVAWPDVASCYLHGISLSYAPSTLRSAVTVSSTSTSAIPGHMGRLITRSASRSAMGHSPPR